MSAPVQDGLIAEWQARDATPTEALNAWTERAAKLEAENAKLRRERREPQPVTLDDAYAAIRGAVEENKRLSAEVKELRRGPAGTFAEAIDLIRDQARDSEGVIDTVRRLIESQARPASPRMLAAIQEQAREGETPDQTVERLLAELDAAGSALVDLRADLASTEHDLARLIRFARGVWTMPELKKLVDDIADRGAPGWLERALSDETAEPVRQERTAWEARVSEAVQEGERRIDAVEKERKKLATRVADLRTKLHDARDQLQTVLDEAFGMSATMELPELIQAVGREAHEQFKRTFNYEQEVRIALGAKVVESTLEAAKRASRPTPALLATIQAAIPAIRAGINALGSSEEDVRQRNAARDSLHALEAAAEGQAPPAAVLSAAERKAVEALRRWRELPDERLCDPVAAEWLDVLEAADAMIEAGRPLASEGKEG